MLTARSVPTEAYAFHQLSGPVTVTEQPPAISSLLTDLPEEVRQSISRTTQSFRNAAGRTMGDDVVYLPAVGVQVPPGLSIFFLRREFLRPPGLAYDPILPSVLPEQTEKPFVIVGNGRVQDTVLDIMRGGSAHGEEGVSFQREDLPAREVDDVGTEKLNLAAVPFPNGVFGKSGEVFVVAIHEGDG